MYQQSDGGSEVVSVSYCLFEQVKRYLTGNLWWVLNSFDFLWSTLDFLQHSTDDGDTVVPLGRPGAATSVDVSILVSN